MKPYICAVAALFCLATAGASAQNSNLPPVQNTYMSGSSSRSAYQQNQQRLMQMQQMQRMQQGGRQGAGTGVGNLGQSYGRPQPQQPAGAMPPQSTLNPGLPQVRTSRYCGMPGEDMVKNNVRSAAIQARTPRPVVQQQQKPAAPQGPTYSYSGGYEYTPPK